MFLHLSRFFSSVTGQDASFASKGTQLTGAMPPEIQHLTDLQRLLIPDMGLTGRFLNLLTNMTKLVNLSVPKNKFTGSIPDSFRDDHPNLAILDFSSNALTGTIPLSFGHFENLTTLDLSTNSLQGSIPSELGNITALRK